jgi:peptidoglycan/LPS O-acetylase OafA/YrhL
MQQPGRRLPALTALRFVAAAVVVIAHSAAILGCDALCLEEFAHKQAVTFFFVLSGFLLYYAYPKLQTWSDRGRFLWARFARLWPAYVVALLLPALVLRRPEGPFSSALGPSATFALHLGMSQAWAPDPALIFAWNPVAWSVSTEFAFYACFLLLLPAWRQTWPLKLALTLALAVGAILLANALIPREQAFAATPHDLVNLVYVHPLARLFEFALGMATAELWRRVAAGRNEGFWRATARELAALLLLAAAAHLAPRWALRTLPWAGQPGAIWLAVSGGVCVPCALLIAVFAEGRGLLSRLLTWQPLVILGEASYGLYLLHYLPLSWLREHPGALEGLPCGAAYAVYWAALLAASILLWLLVERPARRWLVRIAAKGNSDRVPLHQLHLRSVQS